MGHSVRIVCFTLLAVVSYARCLFDGEEFFAERGVSSSSLKVSRREGSSPRLWHVDLCHVFDAPPSCGANQRANLFELGSTDNDCRGAYVAAGDVWSRVTLPSLGVALTNFFVDATRNETLYVLLQCGQETKLHARSDVNTAAVSRALHGAQWLALTSPNLPSKLCGRLNTTTTPGKPTRPTTSTLPPATSSSPAASSTTALTPTTVPIPTTGAPPAACYVSNGDAFTLPFVTIPFSSYNPYNTTYMGVNFWTFSLCEPTTITPGCPSTVPAYIFDSAGVGQAENQIGPCLNAYWARDSTYWEYMGPGRLQKIFTALDDSGLSVNVTLLCGPSPLLEPYSNNNNGNEWSVNTTDQTWMITLLTSNVPGCPAATPPPVVTDCELMYLESETININVTDPDGAVVPTTWSYNLCTPKTYAEQCGGDNSNTSQLPVFIWLHSRNGTGCEIAFTYQEPWQQLNAIFLLTLYSIDMRFVINMTIVPGVMTPLFPLTLTWPTVMVDEGRKTMFNMLLSSTAAGQPLTYCQAVDNTYFSLPWINVSVPVSAQPGTPPRQQFWVISPCGPIQNPYCSGTQTVDYVTQQVGPSRESRCGSVFVPVMEFGPDPWQFLRGKNNAGFFSVFNNTFNVPLNITIRCCANCTVLEVDPAGPQWTDSAIFLASNALPDTVCNSPTTTPAPFTPPPGAACTYEGGSTFTLPPFSGTYPTYYLGESQPVMETWTFQLCGLSQPPTCVESSPISVLWNTECVQQYQMDFPDWIFTGNGVGAHFASNIARVHVNVSCGGSSELALTNTEIMQDLGADGEPVFKLHFTSNLLPSTVCDVRPPAPPGPGAFCPGTNAYLPKLSVQWPLFVPNSEHPVVQKLWNISLCTLQVSLGCAHLAPTNFILSMDDTDESDCQVAFVTQTQPWSATSYLGYSGISAVFTNAAGSRLATVTVVSAGSSPLQPFSPQGLGGWPVTKLADSYSWDLYFYSNAL